MDISRGESVEHELNRLIEKRHDRRATEEGHRPSEELWRASVERYNSERESHLWGRSVYQATDREIALLERVEDLPEEARKLYERMDPAKQPERERWLYEYWESAKRWRELSQKRRAWHHEHRWDKPTPEHLLPGGSFPPAVLGRALTP